MALMLPTQKQSLLSPSRSVELLLPETLMWRGIYQAGAQMPNSLPSGSVNCAHLPQGSVLSSLEMWSKRWVMARSGFSATRAADLIEYVETAARYEYMD